MAGALAVLAIALVSSLGRVLSELHYPDKEELELRAEDIDRTE